MIGTTNIAQKIPKQVLHARAVEGREVHPRLAKKAGTFDCKASNAVYFQLDQLK